MKDWVKDLVKDSSGHYSSRLVYAPFILAMAFILACLDKPETIVGIFMTSFTACVGLSVVDRNKKE